ncbi:MAG: type II toxin-antitoxin system antitoxin SocA domain-containing protein [bacterium]
MLKAINIANTFIKMGLDKKKPITNMKLQKLLYYAQGWYLALTGGESLFEEDFKRWNFGPVCPEVYNKFKKYKAGPIDCIYKGEPVVDDQDIKRFLEKIWDMYGKYTGGQLSILSHNESPWIETEEYETISKDKIELYYCRKIRKYEKV